jgi:hypothetical protein
VSEFYGNSKDKANNVTISLRLMRLISESLLDDDDRRTKKKEDLIKNRKQ